MTKPDTNISERACNHEDLHFDIHITSFEINVKSIEIKCHCKQCKVKFVFLGLPLGLSYAQPTSSLDRLEIRMPVCPEGIEPDKAPGLIGGIVRAGEALKGNA